MFEEKILSLSEAKLDGDGPGRLSGYASTFGNVDSYGDTIVPGAYKGTIPQFLKDGFIPWGHDWSGYPVATPDKAREDDRGLWIEAVFHTDPESQRARQLVSERLERGKSMGLSIGYQAKSFDFTEIDDRQVRRLTEIELMEVSLVMVPADSEARVAGIKARRRISRSQLEGAIAVLSALLGDDEDEDVADELSAGADDGKSADESDVIRLESAALDDLAARTLAHADAFAARLQVASAAERVAARTWAAHIAARMAATKQALDVVLRRADEEAELDTASLFRVADMLDVRYGVIEGGLVR